MLVTASVLRQWYTQYHPAAGPFAYHSAVALEAAMGDELRSVYADLDARPLVLAFGRRRKPVHVDHRVCRTWLEQYG